MRRTLQHPSNSTRDEESAVNTVTAQSAASAAKPRQSNPFGHLSAWRRLVAPAVSRPFSIVETIVFIGAVFAVSYALDGNDPFLMRTGFPWLWFAPLIVALRYGTLLGVLGCAMLVGAYQVLTQTLHQGGAAP